jgi:hypothetical protein
VLRFPNGGLNVSRGQIGKEEEGDDDNFNGTRPNKVNIVLGPKMALKALRERKQARRDESQPSPPIEETNLQSTSDVPVANSTPTSGLPLLEKLLLFLIRF